MRRRFDNNLGNHSKKNSIINMDEINNKNQITSPYITFSRDMPKDVKREHLKRLKNHVDSFINKP